MKIQSILSVGAGLLLLMASVTGCNREESKNPSADAASVAASTGTSVHTAPAADEPGTTTQTESTTSAGGKTNGTKAKTTVAATRTAAPTTAPTKTEKPKKEYYSSAVGMWYTVWWDSKEADAQYYEHHWLKETRVKPLKHGYYAPDDPAKLQDDFTYFNRIGIDYLILDDTNNHMADGGNIASHINACFKKAKELGNKAPKLCFAGGSPLLGGNEEGMIGEMDIFYGYANMYKDNTFFWKGKPLFVNFNSPNNYGWQDPKGRFTMRPAAGHTSEGKGYIQKYGLDKIGMYGWVFDYQYNTSEVYGISPGWSRSHNGLSSGSPPQSREQGKRYQEAWLAAVKRKPEMIVVASWNDHAEETGIEAVQLLEPIDGRGQEDPYYYQNITEGYLALKTGYLDGWYYRAESQTKTYQYTGGKLKAVASAPTKAAIIVVPDDYYNWAGVPRV